MTVPKPSRLRWFQLGLRDILALTVICAILLAWWSDRHQLMEQARILQNDLSLRSERNERLLAEYQALVVKYRLPELPQPNAVSGLVVGVTNDGLVEINLGSDDGLRPDEILDVFRLRATVGGTTYLGQIKLTSVDKATAIGIIVRKTRGSIEVNDHVTTRLQ
jgi:hypothetical protein